HHFCFCLSACLSVCLSVCQVNWTEFVSRNVSGSLKVEPESSVLYSSATVFSRVRISYFEKLLPGSDTLTLKSFSLGFILQRLWSPVPSLELQAVGGAYPPSRVEVHRSIDDEFTPSIFKVTQWLSSENGSAEVLGYLQWKPVASRGRDSSVENATPCHHSAPRPISSEDTARASGLVRAFYAEPEPQTVGLNLSFGLAGDPFYNSTRFLRWTVLIGSGSPPVESFSPLVLAIMAVGLGTPMILLVLGGAYVCVRKRAAASAAALAYVPIN
ncbi:glycosylated lysosomal membrane protein, partial [Perca fluviatilis]|uniref:glycosylated lysosomal membrane protein n=1 Tax=Perca fluviatilis TaxID=8168 RepID=UPI0019667C2E